MSVISPPANKGKPTFSAATALFLVTEVVCIICWTWLHLSPPGRYCVGSIAEKFSDNKTEEMGVSSRNIVRIKETGKKWRRRFLVVSTAEGVKAFLSA